jgi:hypothetical protein
MEPELLIPILGMVGGLGSFVFVVWMVASFLSRRQQVNAAAEFHARLLDRLGSTKDFSDFMNSEGGARFLDTLALQRQNGPQERVLRATASGIVLTILGIGLAMFSGEIPSRREFALAVGFLSAISLSLGIGLLLAAGLTERLARRFGLIRPAGSDQASPVR